MAIQLLLRLLSFLLVGLCLPGAKACTTKQDPGVGAKNDSLIVLRDSIAIVLPAS